MAKMASRSPLVFLALGAGTALGHAPFSLPLLTVVGLFSLFVLWPGAATPRQGAVRAWAFGTGYFLVALHWVFEPFLVDAARHAWMAPFAVLLLSAGLALFWGLAGWLTAKVGGQAVTLALWLAVGELARGYVLTGFPWALPGYVWVDTGLRHWAASIGPYGLTALTLLIPALVARAYKRGIGTAQIATVLLAPAFAWFEITVPTAAPTAAPDAPLIRLVQPNAPQRDKWDPDKMQGFFDRHIALSRTAVGTPPDLIIWSETALPMLLNHADIAFEIMSDAAPDTPFLTGVQRRDDDYRYFNSAVVMENTQVREVYDKHHLVPFGEYMPLQGLAEKAGLQGLAAVLGGYTPGPGPRLIDLGFAKALPLICYEVVFPQDLRGTDRPDVLIQMTNDAWFGKFSGPYQHLAQARMRSVELGLPMIRVANTGVSAVIDARGEVLDSLALNTHGALNTRLPPALSPTYYAKMGDGPVALVLVLLAFGAGGWRFRLTPKGQGGSPV